MMNPRKINQLLASLVLACGVAATATAGPLSGSISGAFSNPDLTGNVLNPDGTTTFFDNTTTAVVDNLGFPTVTWGETVPPTEPGFIFSSLIFTGNSYNVIDDEEFSLGTIRFFNGNSRLAKLIFGLDLTLDAGNGVDLFLLNVDIITTLNSNTDPNFDADLVTVSGLPNTTSLHAFEGQEVRAELFGRIVGDPMIELTRLELLPFGGGFVGSGPLPAPFAVPAPCAALLLGLGLLALPLTRRSEKRV